MDLIEQLQQIEDARAAQTATSDDVVAEAAAQEAPIEGSAAPEAEVSTDTQAAEAAPTPEETKSETPLNVEFNPGEYLDKMSGGLFKDEESFKSALPKISEYESLLKQKQELEAKMAEAPKFANDYIEKLNNLVSSGATKDQIENFNKINAVGSISELSDVEAAVAKMVIVDGYNESTARRRVNETYKLNDDTLPDDDRLDLDDELRVRSQKDRKELEAYKAEAVRANTVSPEEVKLQEEASRQAQVATATPVINKMTESLTNFGSVKLTDKDGGDVLEFDLKVDDDFKSYYKTFLENLFINEGVPVTEDSIKIAQQAAEGEYWRQNYLNIAKKVRDITESQVTERMVAKYENRSGLKQEQPLVIGSSSTDAEQLAFLRGVAGL